MKEKEEDCWELKKEGYGERKENKNVGSRGKGEGRKEGRGEIKIEKQRGEE